MKSRWFIVYLSLLSLVPFFNFNIADASSVIFSDGFEDDFNEWTGNDMQWDTKSGGNTDRHGGASRADVVGDSSKPGTDNVLLKVISTEGYENISLAFWYKIKDSLEDSDHVYIEWTADGSNWNVINDFTVIVKSGTWEQGLYSLPAEANDKVNFAVRFRALLGSGGDVFYLDDVAVSATGVNSTPTPTPSSTLTPTPSPIPTSTPTPSPTPSVSKTPTPLPAVTRTPISTSSPQATPTPDKTSTPIFTPNPPSADNSAKNPLLAVSPAADYIEEASGSIPTDIPSVDDNDSADLSASIGSHSGRKFMLWSALLSVFGAVAFAMYRKRKDGN